MNKNSLIKAHFVFLLRIKRHISGFIQKTGWNVSDVTGDTVAQKDGANPREGHSFRESFSFSCSSDSFTRADAPERTSPPRRQDRRHKSHLLLRSKMLMLVTSSSFEEACGSLKGMKRSCRSCHWVTKRNHTHCCLLSSRCGVESLPTWAQLLILCPPVLIYLYG